MLDIPIKFEGPTAWRIAATILWIVSITCLFKAVNDGVTAEAFIYNPRLTATDRIAIQHLSHVADYWAIAGWVLQLATAAVLSAGINSKRVVRRIFVALGVLIGADGVSLLLMAIIIH